MPQRNLQFIKTTEQTSLHAYRSRRNAAPPARAQALRALNTAGPMVYAIRTRDGLIKIGFSADVATRRRRIGNDLLAVAFGGRTEEQAIHDRLGDYHRARGREFYYPTLEVLAVVNEMRADLGLAPLLR